MRATKLNERVGMEIDDVDLAKPISEKDAQSIRDAYIGAGIVVFRNQNLTKQQLVDASRILGEVDLHPIEGARDAEVPELIIIGAKGETNWSKPDAIVGRAFWHSDLCYVPTPCRGAMLYGAVLPVEGGQTGVADTALAYDTLDESLKRQISTLHVAHSWRYTMTIPMVRDNPAFTKPDGTENLEEIERYNKKFPDVIYPMVVTHPVTGRKALSIAPQFAAEIVEMPGTAGWDLLDRLVRHITRPEHLYWHHYRKGDILAWDNWRTVHAAAGAKAKFGRTMWRTTIKGSVPFGRILRSDETSSTRQWQAPGIPLILPEAA